MLWHAQVCRPSGLPNVVEAICTNMHDRAHVRSEFGPPLRFRISLPVLVHSDTKSLRGEPSSLGSYTPVQQRASSL